MKTFVPPFCSQGDLNIMSVEQIPEGLKETKAEQHTLAHSETGHHHVIDGNTVRVFDVDDFESYLEVRDPTPVRHLRGFDTHEEIELPPGQYRITRQREYTPEGFRRAAD